MASCLMHVGDTSTMVRFDTNQVTICAGGNQIFSGGNASQDSVTVGRTTGDTDIRLAGGPSDKVLFLQGSSGNVGIGTTSPDFQLDIENSSNAIARIHAGTNASASLRLQNTNHQVIQLCNDDFLQQTTSNVTLEQFPSVVV